MTITEFGNQIAQWMKDRTGEDYMIKPVIKENNQHCLGIVKQLINPNEIIPQLYLEPYYESFRRQQISFEGVASVIEQHLLEQDGLMINNLPDMCNFENNKPYIYYKLVNREDNLEYLKDAPTRTIADTLSLQYRFLAGRHQNNIASTLITNDIMQQWGITEEDLYMCATENTPKLFPLKLVNMIDIMLEDCPPDLKNDIAQICPSMYMITNENYLDGATAILYPETQALIKELYQEDVYIFPSSLHECLIEPISHFTIEEAKRVHHVNQQMVAPEDRLSDCIYALQEGTLVNLSLEQHKDDYEEPDLDE